MSLPLLVGLLLLLPAPALQDGAPDGLAEARGLIERGEAQAAIEPLEARLADSPDDRAVRLLLAEACVTAGQAERALAVLDPLAVEGDPEGLLWLGRAFRELGLTADLQGASRDDVEFYLGEALAWLGEAATVAPAGDERAGLEAGYLALYTFNDHARALQLADRLLASTPDSGEALLLRGCAGVLAYVDRRAAGDEPGRQQACDQAVADLQAALEHLPEDRAEPLWQLLWLYEEQGLADEALAAAQAHLERVPEMDLSALYRLACRFAAEGRAEAARAALAAMIERDRDELVERLRAEDDSTAIASGLGWAVLPLLQRGRLEEALGLLEPLLACDPADAALWNNYALACRDAGERAGRSGRAEEALALFEKGYAAYERALAIDDSDPRVLNDTALMLQYHLHREPQRAAELYRRAIELAEQELAGDPDPERAAYLRSARNDARSNLSRL